MKEKTRQNINYLSLLSKKTKLKCAGVIMLATVSASLASMWPVMLGNLYNGISDGAIRTIAQGFSAVVVFGLIYLSAECIAIVRRVMIDCIIVSHESEIRTRSIEKMLKMPIAYFSGGLKGERTAQLNQGVAGLSQLIKIVCNDIFATVLTAACTLIQVFLHAPLVMTGIMLVYLILTIMISVFQIRSQNGIRESIVAQKNALDGQVCQSIGNLQFIRSISAENYETKRLSPIIRKIGFTEKRHHRCMGTFDCLKQLCKVLFQVIILVVSIVLAANGAMPAGAAITVCLLFQQLIKPIDEVYRFMDETASSVIKAKTLVEVHAGTADEVYAIPSSGKRTNNTGIHLRNVVVVNPEKTKRIAWYEDVFFPSGKKTALRGANGCGKTSLVLALNRYYPVEQGGIELFGKSWMDYSQTELTDTLYYSPQVSYFVEGTVRDNLCYGIEDEISEERLIHALKMVHLTGMGHQDTVIDADPRKVLDIHISEKAEELSGGMKQRLALARAFLRTPKMFIFDEITANLDEAATDYVLGNIERYAASIGAGIIYISHDSKVVSRCNGVVELVNKLRENDSAISAA